jgi:hypothetical protein
MKKNVIQVISPAPVLNIADFREAFGGKDGTQIPKNAQGHPLHYEFVALPGMRFNLEEVLPRHHHCIYRISTKLYPSPKLYIDSRFTRPAGEEEDFLTLPSFPKPSEILARMEKLVGTNYVWGGNWSAGISELLHYYPPQGSIDEKTKIHWTLQGVDCSGLLYEATGGLTPRNTTELIRYGHAVRIEGRSPGELFSRLRPLDLVVWPGHVWFVFDSIHSIESKSPFGVIKRDLLERLEETCSTRSGVNAWASSLDPEKHFVVRRI